MILLVDYTGLVTTGATLPAYRHLISALSMFYLMYLVSYGLAIDKLGVRNHYLPTKTIGKYTSVVPDKFGNQPEKPGGNGLVCFIVGSSQNQ